MEEAKYGQNSLSEEERLVILDYRLYPNTSHIHPHMCG